MPEKFWTRMTLLIVTGCLCAIVLTSLPVRADDALPQLKVSAVEDFTVTGDGSAKAWEQVEWTPLSKRPSGPLDYKTQVKMLYSKTGVYVLMDAEDKKLSATMQKDFDMLWMEDVMEVFLWPDEQISLYFEYEISPLSRELAILVPNIDGKIMGWAPWFYFGDRVAKKQVKIMGGPAESGAEITGWRAEIFIPYKLLNPLRNVPPESGTRWRANFYRMDYDAEVMTSWDWARVGENFHEPAKFGTLIFE